MARLLPILLSLIVSTGCTQRITVVKAGLENSEIQTSDRKGQSNSSDPIYDSYLNDGLILFRQADYDGACRLFAQAIEISASGWQAHYYLGLALGKKGKHSLARGSFQASLAFAPDDKRTRSRIYVAMAEGWEKQGNLGQAKLNYITALNLCPESSSAIDGLERIERLRQQSRR